MAEQPGSSMETWGDLRVGDRVYLGLFGNRIRPRALEYELLELRSTTAAISGDSDVVAAIRDVEGRIQVVSARMLRRA